MTFQISIAPMAPGGYRREVDIAERKGRGHPDTLCDALAERVSIALSRLYLERFDTILHHNVDKALLRGGAARPRFGGGEVIEPMEVYLAGRAVTEVDGETLPLREVAVEAAKSWLREQLHALDVERDVKIHFLVRGGSSALTELFGRRNGARVPLANDTSFGVGYAPLSPLERATLELEQMLNSKEFVAAHPAHGEDVKVMAVQNGDQVTLTIARAFIGKYLASLDEYRAEKRELESLVVRAAAHLGRTVRVYVNAADAADGSSIYLTVTGTSAESGDDGQVGRGNRANGLITPLRPMSLEAIAGKNPVSHVGKLYNLSALHIAEALVSEVPATYAAECYLVSRIGAPIDEPAFAHVRLGCVGALTRSAQARVRDVVEAGVRDVPRLWRTVLEGRWTM